MSLQNVEKALRGDAETALGSIPFTRPNTTFDPPRHTKWARVWFLPNQPRVYTLGDEGANMVDGILQIDMIYPLGTGQDAAQADYESLFASRYKAGHALTYSGQEVRIKNCGRANGRENVRDGHYTVSTTVSWYALIPR